jgi:hypothetical protein
MYNNRETFNHLSGDTIMPKVKSRVVHTVSEDDRNFDTTFAPVDDTTVKILPDGRAVVGYLVVDDDCENPLENCDAMGRIYSRMRHSGQEEKFYAAFGRNTDGTKYGKPNPFAVMLDCYEHSGVVWSVAGEGYQCQWDTSGGAGVWVPDDCCVEHIYYTAIRALLPEGTDVSYKGNNNVITCTLPDGVTYGGYKSFVTAIRAAAKYLGITLDKDALAKEARKVAVVCARQACETYTDWCNGSVYGVVVEVFDANDEVIDELQDACWGYIGSKYAEEELEGAVKCKVAHLTN